MADIVSSPPSPNIRKRQAPDDESPGKKPLNLKGSQFIMPTPPDTDQSSNVSPNASLNNDEQDRAASPAPSSSALSSVADTAPSNPVQPNDANTGASSASNSTSGPPPAKKRKLTPSEKLEKQKAKEVKEREKAEEKARKEEEKARKEEEKQKSKEAKDEKKRIKDEETRKKAEEREAKRREKELEEERKNQEKLKKERSQLRLGAFFQQKPTTPAKDTDTDEYTARARRRSLSLEKYDDIADEIRKTGSPMKGTPPPSEKKPSAVCDYKRSFLPFQLPTDSTLAPLAVFSEAAQDAFDREVENPSLREQFDLGIVNSYEGHANVEHYFTRERNSKRGVSYSRTKKLVDVIHGTSQQPIDLTNEGGAEHSLDLLRQLPVRLIQFEEDIRPPYSGTYTKVESPRSKRKVSRNPFTKARQDTDYGYDSEAEWEPPEEGDEELLSDGEDEADSQADADDEGFLDDEDDDGKSKRKIITSELVPTSTGLCWAGRQGRIAVVDGLEATEQPTEMQGMRMGILLPVLSGTAIDPFSTSYWDSSPSQTVTASGNDKPSSTIMAPPRQPLVPRPNANGPTQTSLVGAAEGMKGPITTSEGAKRGRKPAPKTLSKEDLDEFKIAVVGSDVGKLDLQKSLKTRYV